MDPAAFEAFTNAAADMFKHINSHLEHHDRMFGHTMDSLQSLHDALKELTGIVVELSHRPR